MRIVGSLGAMSKVAYKSKEIFVEAYRRRSVDLNSTQASGAMGGQQVRELVATRNRVEAKRVGLAAYMASAKKDGEFKPEETLKISSVRFHEECMRLNQELNELQQELESLVASESLEAA